MELKRLLYVSFAPDGFNMERNLAILDTARRANLASGLTGVLLCRDALYLQVLEGPQTQLVATFEAIRRDRRHMAVTVLAEYPVNSRIFPSWQMGFYHMTAIESTVGEVLIGNADEGLHRILAQYRDKDPIACTVDGFLRANAKQMRLPVPQPA